MTSSESSTADTEESLSVSGALPISDNVNRQGQFEEQTQESASSSTTDGTHSDIDQTNERKKSRFRGLRAMTHRNSISGVGIDSGQERVPFPMLRAEGEGNPPGTWIIPRVRSALYDAEAALSQPENRENAHVPRRAVKQLKAWYSSYTTIDWLHDDVREQARLRALRSTKGTNGWWINRIWDPAQGWLLVILVGILCGLSAGFISEWSELLASWKTGYCKVDWRLSKGVCCRQSAVPCELWTTWRSFGLPAHSIYVAAGVLYTLIAVLMVVHSATRVTVANRAVPSSVETSVSPTLKIAYYGAGSGIPEVKSILAGFVIHGFLGVRMLFVKTFGLILCCASGIMAGKEGPMVQIASSFGNISTRIFDKYYRNEAKKREIISASAAAGVSVAFGAPIGGVLFSLEEVSYFFPDKTMLRSLTCALVAALVLKAYDPFGTGKLVLFQTSYDMDYHWFEMLPFLLIGVFGGLYGALFCKLNMAINRLRKDTIIGKYPVVEVVAITTVTLAMSYSNPFTRVGLGELVGSFLQECPADRTPYLKSSEDSIERLLCPDDKDLSAYMPLIQMFAVTLVNRAVFAIVTFGMKVPAGLVLPSMSIGAVFGRLVGTFMEYLTREYSDLALFAKCPSDGRCVIPGVYALVGAGATLTGATHTTIAVVAILMELTGNLIYTLPVLVGVMTARWVADYFSPSGIYDMLLEHAGHPYLDTRTQYIHTKRTARELMQCDLEPICVDYADQNTIANLEQKLTRISDRGLGDSGFPIVNSRGHLLGWIACAELEYALSRCAEMSTSTVCFFDNPLWQAEYVANDPLAIPHRRTPLAYAKEFTRAHSSAPCKGKANGGTSDGWRWWRWAKNTSVNDSDSGAARPLLGSEHAHPVSYQSSEHTANSEHAETEPTCSSTRSANRSRETTSGTQKRFSNPNAVSVSMPYFKDRLNDFTPYVDQTPLAISTNSPIELVGNLLARLGVSNLCVTEKGVFKGVIFKKYYIGYLKELEEHGYTH